MSEKKLKIEIDFVRNTTAKEDGEIEESIIQTLSDAGFRGEDYLMGVAKK